MISGGSVGGMSGTQPGAPGGRSCAAQRTWFERRQEGLLEGKVGGSHRSQVGSVVFLLSYKMLGSEGRTLWVAVGTHAE